MAAPNNVGRDDVQDYVSAMLNILEDSSDEKNRLADTERAVLNILDDYVEERTRVNATQIALVNILEDANEERLALSDTQSAVLNILEDFEAEKDNVERINFELKRANGAVETANSELEAFSYSVAHDMRAPLRSIDGFSLALLEDCADQLPEDGKGYLRHIRDAAQYMARLIDDLLALSRVSRADLNLADIDLSDEVHATVERLKRSAPARAVEMVIAPGLVASADPRLIGILFDNLIGNAWKFSVHTPSPRIEFGSLAGGQTEVFFVRDNGAGFDMDYAAKLFVPFQRLHKVSEFDGTGIGLATVQRIVARHGGRIWAEAKVDCGATFYFTLGEDA